MDGRYYMLDLARSFPPEALTATAHLSDLLEDGTSVLVFIPPCVIGGEQKPSKVLMGTIYKAYIEGKSYDILLETGKVLWRHPVEFIRARTLSIFWRLLRPEYVRDRGVKAASLSGLSSDAMREGIDLVSTLAGAVTDDAINQVTNFFDVVAPALAEMSGAVDTVATKSSALRKLDNPAPPMPKLDRALSAHIANAVYDAVYDEFESENAAAAASAAAVSEMPTNCDLGYDGIFILVIFVRSKYSFFLYI